MFDCAGGDCFPGLFSTESGCTGWRGGDVHTLPLDAGCLPDLIQLVDVLACALLQGFLRVGVNVAPAVRAGPNEGFVWASVGDCADPCQIGF